MTPRVGRFAKPTPDDDENGNILDASQLEPAKPKGLNKKLITPSLPEVNSEHYLKAQSEITNQLKEQPKMTYNKIGTIAHIDNIGSSSVKLEDIQGQPFVIFDVEFTQGSFNNKVNTTSWSSAVNLLTGEPARIVSSAYAVVLQLKTVSNAKAFPVIGKFLKKPFNNNKRWEFTDIEITETNYDESDLNDLIENAKQHFSEFLPNTIKPDMGDIPF